MKGIAIERKLMIKYSAAAVEKQEKKYCYFCLCGVAPMFQSYTSIMHKICVYHACFTVVSVSYFSNVFVFWCCCFCLPWHKLFIINSFTCEKKLSWKRVNRRIELMKRGRNTKEWTCFACPRKHSVNYIYIGWISPHFSCFS